MASSRILLIGATGSIGRFIAKASVKLGHPTYILVRDAAPSDSAKAALLKSFTDGGATLVTGDLYDHASLVSALKQVDVVISTLGGAQYKDQIKILDAIKEAGTIRRFYPSEFGNDVDRMELDIPVTASVFGTKVEVRRAIEKSGVPYTYVVAGAFASWYLGPIVQDLDPDSPPRHGKLVILGDGNAKATFTAEDDIATFTITSVDDPRAENKLLHIRAKENILSTNEVVAKWERLIGHDFEKEHLAKEAILKQVERLPFPENLLFAIKYSIFYKGDETSYDLAPPRDVEATQLYPGVKYTTADEYLSKLV